MANLAVINATDLSSYAHDPIVEGRTSFEQVVRYARSLPQVDKVIVLAGEERESPDYETVVGESWNLGSFFATLVSSSAGYDHVFYCYGDCPLLDSNIAARMWKNHQHYFAQFSFADGYPYGLSPELLAVEIIPSVAALVDEAEAPIKRDSLFSVIQKDINSFDIETELSPQDLRLLRVSLTADTRRNFRQLGAVIQAGGCDEESVLGVLNRRPELLRTLPAYLSVEIIDGCPQACSYCPFPTLDGDVLTRRNEMTTSDFETIVAKIASFCEDAVINISMWGEPALHSDLPGVLEAVCRYDGLRPLVETSGVGFGGQTIERIQASIGNRAMWILSLDALDQDLYRELRGEGYEEAHATAEKLIATFPGQVHVQAVRMERNEEKLEEFYRYWKEKTENVIVQKYDHFSGLLPARKVTDLSPLSRFPCWHLKRDLTVRVDGTVTVCREDIHRNHLLGNVLKEELADIWARGEDWYERHIAEDYPDICRTCDEYYTYNF